MTCTGAKLKIDAGSFWKHHPRGSGRVVRYPAFHPGVMASPKHELSYVCLKEGDIFSLKILQPKGSKSGDSMTSRALRTSLLTLSWIPVVYAFTSHVYQPYKIKGISMAPALNPATTTKFNDIVLVRKYFTKEPLSLQRGDIVLFRSPLDPEKILTKRIVGLQGEVVRTRCPPYPKIETTIPRNHYWVEGDNTMHSMDSNNFGPISQGLVIGKAEIIIWPMSRIGSELKKGGRDARLPV